MSSSEFGVMNFFPFFLCFFSLWIKRKKFYTLIISFGFIIFGGIHTHVIYFVWKYILSARNAKNYQTITAKTTDNEWSIQIFIITNLLTFCKSNSKTVIKQRFSPSRFAAESKKKNVGTFNWFTLLNNGWFTEL